MLLITKTINTRLSNISLWNDYISIGIIPIKILQFKSVKDSSYRNRYDLLLKYDVLKLYFTFTIIVILTKCIKLFNV